MSLYVQSEKGSALYLALLVIALSGIVMAAAFGLTAQMSKDAQTAQVKDSQDKFNQLVESIAGDADSCLGVGSMGGLNFVSNVDGSIGKNKFSLDQPGQTEQDVQLTSNIEMPSGALQIIHGKNSFSSSQSTFDAFNNLRIDRLYIRAARAIDTFNFAVELVQQSSIGDTKFAPRIIGDLMLSFTSGTLSGCILKQTAEGLCAEMGCRFNKLSKQKCACGFPEMSCTSNPGQPLMYIAGIDTTTDPPTPKCATFKVSCLDRKGPGFALSGIDTNGDPVCEPVEGEVNP